ncbi:EAL domain-containing protein [Vibrio sp. S9_S30]|uniref:putative bifunctional diguanylate cyclase/phosphodiesterase n=1 Tax=Vibrio sp. S9_S30 TaxID=2720226 RepID=UPI001680D6BE|nr:bifunctional diguanylate cyclase/phosphodiesterase [Vibrio sp. S9_S30]MBD1558053.1 EAL domain-containing protein [Vibrio sp. S9_S30]
MERNNFNDTTISMSDINTILLLDGNELLEKTCMLLHEKLHSFCTCIVELNELNRVAATLVYVQEGNLVGDLEYDIKNTPCEQAAEADTEFCFYPERAYRHYPNDPFLVDFKLESYLGYPLKNQEGKTLGILISTFKLPIGDSQPIIHYHKLFSKIIIHQLRAKWLVEKADTLLNQLSEQTKRDNLTKLYNRFSLSHHLEHLMISEGNTASLALIDIDGFKEINDLYGTHVADRVLLHTTQSIQRCFNPVDTLYRIDGDEFAAICSSEQVEIFTKALIDLLNIGFTYEAFALNFSISIGIVSFEDAENGDDLLLKANLALKLCKQDPLCNLQFYDSRLSAMHLRRSQVVEALKHDLTSTVGNSALSVALQPIVLLNGEPWRKFEVLARWNDPKLGVIAPDEFIEAAEHTGMISKLGERVFELACEAKVFLENALGYSIELSVNCSAKELAQPKQYLSQLSRSLQRYQFSAHEFTIELTETVLMTQSGDIRLAMRGLHEQGFKIALDDFGTGYSSLNYIHRYDIDCIKIDKTFVQNMLTNLKSERIVKLIIELAKQLQVNIIAEGVETESELNKLVEMGCSSIQGYLFSCPLSPPQLIQKIKYLRPRR